jgi:CBS-domain-containing membrane protein
LASFGASCVLIFGFPDSPLSQPRNVIGGHFLASLVGLTFLALFGAHWWSMALAVGTAIAVMLLTRTAHAPAGSNPLIVMLSAPIPVTFEDPALLAAHTLPNHLLSVSSSGLVHLPPCSIFKSCGYTWSFLLTPTLIGAIVIVAVALIFNNLPKDRHYPTYWI